jgi:hypothetical protein
MKNNPPRPFSRIWSDGRGEADPGSGSATEREPEPDQAERLCRAIPGKTCWSEIAARAAKARARQTFADAAPVQLSEHVGEDYPGRTAHRLLPPPRKCFTRQLCFPLE